MFLKNLTFLAVFLLIFVMTASCGDIDHRTKGSVDRTTADAKINDERLSTPQKVMDLFLEAQKTKDLRLLQAVFSDKIEKWSFTEYDILKIVSLIKADKKSVVEKYMCNYGDYIFIVLQKPKGLPELEFEYILRKFDNAWKIIGHTFIPNENYPPLDPEEFD